MGEMASHHETLRQRHAQLESEIETETNRPAPDELLIQTLKKKKLLLKEEMITTGQ